MQSAITLREAFESHYDTSELAPRSVEKYRHVLNAWERHTGDPHVDAIDDEAAEQFRASCLSAELKPATINTQWGDIRAILNRLGPRERGNPRGLGIIDQVPWMRPVKTVWKRPTRVKLTDLSAVYVAARTMTNPYRRIGIAPADWWRTLIVLAYGTALRRADLFAIQWCDIDWDDRSLAIDPEKTGKADWLPLPEFTLSHLV